MLCDSRNRWTVTHEKWYYIFTFIMVFWTASSYSQVLKPLIEKTSLLWTIVSFVAMLAVIATSTKVSLTQLVCLFVFGVFGALIYLMLGRTAFLYLTVLFVYSKGKDPDKICNLMLKTLAAIFLFNVLCTGYFLVFNRSQLYIRSAIHETRLQLDLSCGGHPNHAAALWNAIVMLWSYTNWEKITFRHWTWVLVLTGIIYICIGSEAIAAIFLLFLFWLLRKNQIIFNVLKTIVKYGVIIMIVFSLLYVWISNVPFLHEFAVWLNEMSTGRFALGARALELYGTSWLGANNEFGQLVIGGLEEYVYADNAYIYMMVNQGMIYLVAIQLIVFFSAKWLDYKATALLMVLLCFGLAETNMTSYIMIFPMINAMIEIFRGIGKSTMLTA